MASCVRGYHVYRQTCDATVGKTHVLGRIGMLLRLEALLSAVESVVAGLKYLRSAITLVVSCLHLREEYCYVKKRALSYTRERCTHVTPRAMSILYRKYFGAIIIREKFSRV